VYICDGLYGLEFDDDVAQDEEIEPVKTNFDTSIEYRDRKLALERNGTMSEFDREGLFVYRLNESRSKLFVDLNGGTDDFPGLILIFERHIVFLPGFLVSSEVYPVTIDT